MKMLNKWNIRRHFYLMLSVNWNLNHGILKTTVNLSEKHWFLANCVRSVSCFVFDNIAWCSCSTWTTCQSVSRARTHEASRISQRGCPPIIWDIFPEKCVKINKFCARRGGGYASLVHPLRYATAKQDWVFTLALLFVMGLRSFCILTLALPLVTNVTCQQISKQMNVDKYADKQSYAVVAWNGPGTHLNFQISGNFSGNTPLWITQVQIYNYS